MEGESCPSGMRSLFPVLSLESFIRRFQKGWKRSVGAIISGNRDSRSVSSTLVPTSVRTSPVLCMQGASPPGSVSIHTVHSTKLRCGGLIHEQICVLAVRHLLFFPRWWHFSLRGVGCWDERVGLTEQNPKVSQAATSIHTAGKPLELQRAQRSTHITASNSEALTVPLPKPRGFGVGSSQHPYKTKAKLELKPCFGTAHVPPVLQHRLGPCQPAGGVRWGWRRGLAGVMLCCCRRAAGGRRVGIFPASLRVNSFQ